MASSQSSAGYAAHDAFFLLVRGTPVKTIEIDLSGGRGIPGGGISPVSVGDTVRSLGLPEQAAQLDQPLVVGIAGIHGQLKEQLGFFPIRSN